MKRFLLSLILLTSSIAHAFDSSSAYNVVAMSFPANQMIFNRVVLDSTQKAQTSVTFTADVQNGGGRPTHNLDGTPRAFPTQTDSAFIRIRLYDNAGTLLNTVTSPTYTLRNLGSDPSNGFSTKPGDNQHPWTLASVTYTGDLSNVRFVQLEMVGTDGAFWAGNYGPMWRVPTVTFGSNSTNTVYNPEFGIAPNSVRAQGWFNSSNSWAVCGVTSGNVPCVTSVAGVNANMWGGGYDINGGSLAGTTGGYNGTLTSTTADNAAATGSPTPAAPPPPAPTAIYNNSSNVFITRAIPTSANSPGGEGPNNAFDNNPNTKYLNFDKKNAGVTVQLNAGRAVTGFTVTTANDFSGRDPTSYKLYGSNDGSTWTLIKEAPISLSESRFWTSPVIDVANTTPYAYYFMLFPTTKAGDGCGLNCDSMQIAEITYYYDANSTATSTATNTTIVDPVTAAANTLCCGGSAAPITADTGFAARAMAFRNRTTADSQVYIEQIGNDNTITVLQSGTRNNFVDYFGNGSFNTVTVTQSGNSSTQANYIEANVGTAISAANSNSVTLTQQSTGGAKGMLVNVTGSSNTLDITQKDSGSHYAQVSLTGGNKNVNILQQGSASHMANISLGGTPTALDLTQSGSTQQHYSITHTCATAGGCGLITVTQGN